MHYSIHKYSYINDDITQYSTTLLGSVLLCEGYICKVSVSLQFMVIHLCLGLSPDNVKA